jgi:hypothetical protein
MRKITILLTLLIFLQGCVSPKTGQISIPLPKNISYPSALVIKDKYLGVLSMEGKFDPLYKVDGKMKFSPLEIIDTNKQKSCSFLVKSKSPLSSTCSLWDLNFSTQKLNCLIPSLRNISSSGGIYLTPDKKYFEYPVAYLQKDIRIHTKKYWFSYHGIFDSSKLYSVNQQQLVKIPEIKGLKFYYLQVDLLPDRCFLVYKNKKNPKDQAWYLYLWDLKNNLLIPILFPELRSYQFSRIIIEKTNDSNQMIIQVGQENIIGKSKPSSIEMINSIYLLDLDKEKAKFLFSTAGNIAEYYKEFDWLLFTENKTLIRYDIRRGTIETLYQLDNYRNFTVFDNKTILVKISKSTSILELLQGKNKMFQVIQSYYLMKPNGTWAKINDFFNNEIIDYISPISFDSFLLSIDNRSKEIHQVIKWNPLTNSKEIILEEKNCTYIGISKNISLEINMNENYRTFSEKQVGCYIQFIVKVDETEKQNYIYNRFTKEMKIVPVLNSPERYARSTGQLIWIYEKTSYKTTNISLLDWKNPTNASSLINFTEKTHQKKSYYTETISPDKTYIPIIGFSKNDYSDEQLWFVNVQTGKELSFPESKDFQFITWLEEK